MKKQSIKGIIIFILLIFGMAYIPYIPLLIFHIDIDSLTEGTKTIYSAACDIFFIFWVS